MPDNAASRIEPHQLVGKSVFDRAMCRFYSIGNRYRDEPTIAEPFPIVVDHSPQDQRRDCDRGQYEGTGQKLFHLSGSNRAERTSCGKMLQDSRVFLLILCRSGRHEAGRCGSPHDAEERLSYLRSCGGPVFPLGRRFQLPPEQRRPSSLRRCFASPYFETIIALVTVVRDQLPALAPNPSAAFDRAPGLWLAGCRCRRPRAPGLRQTESEASSWHPPRSALSFVKATRWFGFGCTPAGDASRRLEPNAVPGVGCPKEIAP